MAPMATLHPEQQHEAQWHSSSVDFGPKARTVQQPQPNDANPNQEESMVKTRTVHR
jgi:hypothetical protein